MKGRKLSRRDFLRMSSLTAAGLVAAACGAAEEKPTATPEVEPTATPEEAAPAEVEPTSTPEYLVAGTGELELSFWSGFAAIHQAVMLEIFEGFAKENPEVSVKTQAMEWGTYFDKMAAAVVAGTGGPDLFVLWHSVMPQYAKAGRLYPLADDMFDLGMLPKDDFLPQLLEAVTIDGKMWTVPFDIYGVGTYLDLDLLEQAGIDADKPPKDANEWLEYATALTWDKNGKHPGESGFDPDNVDVWGWVIGWPRAAVQPALYQWGADVISRDDPPEILINTQGAIDATQFFVDAIYEHNVAPQPAGFDVIQALASHKVGMFPMGAWHYTWYLEQEDIRPAFWPYPRLGPERGSTILWSHTLAVPNDIAEEKLEPIRKLVQYCSDHSDPWVLKVAHPSARLSVAQEYEDQVWSLPVLNRQMREEGVPEYASEHFTEIDDAVGVAWSAALNKDKTVEEALNEAAALIERALA